MLGHVGVVRALLALPPERCNPAACCNAALRVACEHGRADVAALLLALPPERRVNPADNGLDWNIEGLDDGEFGYRNNALSEACRHGRLTVVRMLLALPPARGVRPTARRCAALRLACAAGHMAVVQLLQELTVTPNKIVTECVHVCRRYRSRKVMALLLEQDLDARGLARVAGGLCCCWPTCFTRSCCIPSAS